MALLLACVIALQIVLIGLAFEVGVLERWLKEAPGWIQAIGTVGAVVIAYRAYRDWWQADLARAKSQDAEGLMHDVTEIASLLLRAQERHAFAGTINSRLMERVLSPKRRELMEEIRKRSNQLMGKAPAVRDKKLAKLLMMLAHTADEFWTAFYHLEAYAELLEGTTSEVQISGNVRSYLIMLGAVPSGGGADFPNDFQSRVIKQKLEIIRLLQSHLRFES